MKQIDILNAYTNLEPLANIEDYGIDEQWKLYQLRKQLKEYTEFYHEQELKINKKYSSLTDENGTLKGQSYLDYLNEKEDLNNKEIELTLEKVSLPLVKGINFKTIEALENIIEFTK